MKRLTIIILIFITSINIQAQETRIEKSGDFLQIALPAAALGSTFIWKDETKPFWQFVATLSVSTLVTHSLKIGINKPRPNGGKYSFPSGHTQGAFTGAAFLERRFGWKVGAPAYALAAYVGWTRVHANKHDYWDVLGGAAIGIGTAYLFTKPFKKKSTDISLSSYGSDGLILSFAHKF